LDLSGRKKWLAFFPSPKGSIIVDDGAVDAILNNGSSLLAVGVSNISGNFEKADVVELKDSNENVFARGISRFSKDQLLKIKGMQNEKILSMFPGKIRPEVVHRDHLAALQIEKC